MEIVSMSLLFGGLAAFLLYKYLTSRSQKLPPGPRGLSALLSVLKAFRDGSLHKQAKVWRDQYGELVLCRTVIGDLCFLNSARLVREMYASKERELVTSNRPESFFGWFVEFRHNGVTTADSRMTPDFPKRRRLFHKALKFYGDGVDRFESTVQTELQSLMSRIEARAGEEQDVGHLMSYSLLRIMTVLMTGECPGADANIVRVLEQMDNTMNEMFCPSTDAMLTAFPFLRFVPGTYYRELCQQLRATQGTFIEEFFTKAKATHKPGQERGIVDVMLTEQLKEENGWLADDTIKGIMVDLIGAGYLTSLNTFKSMFLFLAHNPEVIRKIQKEVDDVVGDRMPRVEDMSDLPYTEAVAMETFRCGAVFSLGVPHENTEDITFEGVTVPKGSRIFSTQWVFHHDPEVWGDPYKFRPERFLDDQGQLLPVTHPLSQSLLPFGIGKRKCPGEAFGRSRIFLYITTLFQNFDVFPPVKNQLPPQDPDHYGNGIILEPKSCHLIFRRRS